jgi:hypothetical protein
MRCLTSPSAELDRGDQEDTQEPFDLLSFTVRLSVWDRRSPMSRFSSSDRLSVPDRLSLLVRLSSFDRLSSSLTVHLHWLPRIIVDPA